MNGYERMKAALAGEPVDYRPIMLHDFQMCVKEQGVDCRQFREDPKLAAECFIRNAEKYDLDAVLIDMDTATLAGACGCEVAYPKEGAAVTRRGVLSDICEVGGLKRVRVEDFVYVNHWLEISRLVSDYFKNDKYVRCNCDQAAFSLASMLRGSQDLMLDLLDEDCEGEVLELLRYCEDVSEQFVRLAAQTGAHGVSNGDSVAGPAMISPKLYERFAFPFEEQLARVAKATGKDYGIHICGDTSLILGKMRELPVDFFELDYKTDLREIYRQLTPQITLSGTIDPSGVLTFGGTEDVRRAVEELLEVYKASAKLIVCSGCAIPGEAPEENIRELIRTVRS